MAKFRVYVFDNKEEYTKAQNLIHEKRFNSSSSIHHEMHPDHEQSEKNVKV